MAPRGGYQAPRNPAPVSGPGRLSQRTDGVPTMDLPNPDYGEQQTFRQDQQAAPMGGGQPPVSPADLSGVVPFGAPSQRPMEPVTAGAAAGAGPGPEAMGLDNEDNDPGVQQLRQILPSLELMANMPQAGKAFRQFVRRVRAMM